MQNDYRQARLLVELAAMTAYHGEAFLRATSAISRTGIESYWLASRNRQESWSQALKQLETRALVIATQLHGQNQSRAFAQYWEDLIPVAEEILASEVLTRVWTAIGCELDRRSHGDDAEPFVRSILTKHLECRHRLLRLVFEKLTLPSDQARQLDRTRRRAERWTDVLLGYLVNCAAIHEFAFDVKRVNDFAASLCSQESSPDATRSLLIVSLRSAFKQGSSGQCPHPELNGRICEAVLACFSSDIFDSIGVLKSVWEIRLSQAAEDTQGMIECLAAEHGETSARPARRPPGNTTRPI